jgi:hypothetical protein
MQATIYSLLHQHIQDVCSERGIEIMSPHYRSERDGNMSTIPASYLPKDYVAPGFKINIKKDDQNTWSSFHWNSADILLIGIWTQ